ncbi:MAG: SDR family oxidoreductase [Ruminococcaceae bacterium]|nr:SDR family oxidoreductase [Oscillospiraceae bacterium]
MKTALITGASRGIGTACAIALAKCGYNIVLNYNKSEEEALTLAKIITNNYSVDVLCVKADVSDKVQVDDMVKKAEEKFSTIDVLVNNAGVSLQKLFTDTTPQQWDEVVSTNLTSVYNVTHAVLPLMIKEHSGSIVNISSMWGETGASCEVAYSASKAGVIGLTKALAKEVAPSNVRVNCVTPGVIMTDMMSSFKEDELVLIKEEIPLGVFGTVKNVADTVAFLVSEKASYITGQIVGVNGGMVI